MLITRQNVLSNPIIQSAKLMMLFSKFNPIAYKQYLSGLCRSERFDFYSELSDEGITLRYRGTRFGLSELSIAKSKVYGNGSKWLLESGMVLYAFCEGENIWTVLVNERSHQDAPLPDGIKEAPGGYYDENHKHWTRHYLIHSDSNLEQMSEKIISDIAAHLGECPLEAKEIIYNSIYYAHARPYHLPMLKVLVNGIRFALNPVIPKQGVRY